MTRLSISQITTVTQSFADDLDVYRAAGVGTLIISPMSFDPEQRKRTIRELAEML